MRAHQIIWVVSLICLVPAKAPPPLVNSNSDVVVNNNLLSKDTKEISLKLQQEHGVLEDKQNQKNKTETEALEKVTSALRNRIKNALGAGELDVSSVRDSIMLNLAKDILANSTFERDISLCCASGAVYGSLEQEKKCMVPRRLYKAYKGYASSKTCMSTHAKCCSKARGKSMGKKGGQAGRPKTWKKAHHNKTLNRKVQKLVSKNMKGKKNMKKLSKKISKKFSKGNSKNKVWKNIEIDESMEDKLIDFVEEMPELPDETGQTVEIYETEPEHTVTFVDDIVERDDNSYKENYKMCCKAGKDFRQYTKGKECVVGLRDELMSSDDLIVDETCKIKYMYCCEQAPRDPKAVKVKNMMAEEEEEEEEEETRGRMMNQLLQKISDLTRKVAVVESVPRKVPRSSELPPPTKNKLPKKGAPAPRAPAPRVPAGIERRYKDGKLPEGLRRSPSGHYYYVDKIDPELANRRITVRNPNKQ